VQNDAVFWEGNLWQNELHRTGIPSCRSICGKKLAAGTFRKTLKLLHVVKMFQCASASCSFAFSACLADSATAHVTTGHFSCPFTDSIAPESVRELHQQRLYSILCVAPVLLSDSMPQAISCVLSSGYANPCTSTGRTSLCKALNNHVFRRLCTEILLRCSLVELLSEFDLARSPELTNRCSHL
jgi:hypothetical protein